MNAVTTRQKVDRRRVTRDPQIGLQKIPDSGRGERYVILIDGAGRYAEPSKPLTEADSRKVLHKMGHTAAVIESMIGRAKAAQPR
jgi:hypothetical protein